MCVCVWRGVSVHFTVHHTLDLDCFASGDVEYLHLRLAVPYLRGWIRNTVVLHCTGLVEVWENEDTATRLLLLGWNLQQRQRPLPLSVISLTHTPKVGSQSLAVPSDDTDTSSSLATDQSKSEREREGEGEGEGEGEREGERGRGETDQTELNSPLTGLRWPRSVEVREGGSEERLNTERVPSREAQASRLLSSLANLRVVTSAEREGGREREREGGWVCVREREGEREGGRGEGVCV